MKKNSNKDPKLVELGNRIRTGIEKSGRKQVEFASLLGIYPPNLTRWIQGESAPSFEYLLKIGKSLNVSLDWLLLGKGQPDEENILIAKNRKAEYKTPSRNHERRLPENAHKRELVDKVVKILDSGMDWVKTGLESNIEAFIIAIERRKTEIKGGE